MCCGSNRAAARAAVLAAGNAPAADVSVRSAMSATSVIMFEYVGLGESWIRGPVSGQVYRFRRPGDRLRVDARDRPGLAALPTLRVVR